MSTTKRAGIIYYGSYPENRGIRQLKDVLLKLNAEVFIFARQEGRKELSNEGTSYAQHGDGIFQNILYQPLPFNLFWQQKIYNWAKENKIDFLFVRETPLSQVCLKVGDKLDIPVFLDIRENLSAMYKAGNQGFPVRLIKNKYFVQLNEAKFLLKFDHIFSVSDELGKWVVKNYHVSNSQIDVLGNFPSAQDLQLATEAVKNSKKKNKESLFLVHVGYIKENRGIQDILKAMKLLHGQNLQIYFKILGDGDYIPALKKMVIDLGLEENVYFKPAVAPKKIYQELVECDVGICSYLLNKQTHLTLPGKLFEYMAVGLPVLSSARRPVIRVLNKWNNGKIYKSRDPKEIAEKLLFFSKNPSNRQRMGQNSRKAILQEYNEGENFKKMYEILKA